MTTYRLESLEWRTGLEILSLDFIGPVYNELGVSVRDEAALRAIARDALTGRLGDTVANPQQSTDGEDYYSAYVVPFLESTSRLFGSSGRRKVEYWVMYTVCTENHNPWVLYQHTMSIWAAVYRKTHNDEIGFSVDAARITRELRAAGDMSVAEPVLREQRLKVLTDWDLSVFSKHGLLEIPEGSDFFPLVDAIELTISMHKFHMFWSWLLSFIGAEDLDAIGTYARISADKRKCSYVRPGDLPLLPR